MKKLLLILSMVLFTFSIQAQEEEIVCLRLAYTYSEVKEEVPSIELTNEVGEDLRALQKSEGVWVFYFFNSEEVCCTQVYMYPINNLKGILKNMMADSKYIRVKDLEYLYTTETTIREFTIDPDYENEIVYLSVIEI